MSLAIMPFWEWKQKQITTSRTTHPHAWYHQRYGNYVKEMRAAIDRASAAAIATDMVTVTDKWAPWKEHVRTIREQTGAGLMESKKALSMHNGDTEAAIAWLRGQGLSNQHIAPPRLPEIELTSEWVACRKRPVIVHVREQREGEVHVSTREGITPLKPDDLIMRGVEGEEYPIGRDVFEKTYDLVLELKPVAKSIDPTQQLIESMARSAVLSALTSELAGLRAAFADQVKKAREVWLEENPGEEGADIVTPFDQFLYMK